MHIAKSTVSLKSIHVKINMMSRQKYERSPALIAHEGDARADIRRRAPSAERLHSWKQMAAFMPQSGDEPLNVGEPSQPLHRIDGFRFKRGAGHFLTHEADRHSPENEKASILYMKQPSIEMALIYFIMSTLKLGTAFMWKWNVMRADKA